MWYSLIMIDKLTNEQIEEIIKKLNTDEIGVVWFANYEGYSCLENDEIKRLLHEVGV